ncbi:MAG: site-2 protease family protein [Clostridia bacterium]|jgi:Zn-dependent protease|nr:site-2 protease family protein [Clostridia bacterium]
MPMFSLEGLITLIPAILIAITFHEYAHGKVAALLGDPTPAQHGRLTLNPLAHLDPLGTLMLLVARFGWAKPVPVNPFFFRGNRRKGMLWVGLAGPLMNLVLAYLAAFGLKIVFGKSLLLQNFFQELLFINLALAVFNLIPLPPLDGSKILANLLPAEYTSFFMKIEAYGPIILLVLLATGLLSRIITPTVIFLLQLIFVAVGI